MKMTACSGKNGLYQHSDKGVDREHKWPTLHHVNDTAYVLRMCVCIGTATALVGTDEVTLLTVSRSSSMVVYTLKGGLKS